MDTSFDGSPSCTDLVVTTLLYRLLTITYSNAEFMRDNNKKSSEQIKYKKKTFLDLFVTGCHIHNYYNTRTSLHFRSHACQTNTKQFTILFQGPKIWNYLPNSITSIFLLQSFKTKVFFLLYR